MLRCINVGYLQCIYSYSIYPPPTHTGTDATHADHIETIKTRNYVGVQNDDSLVPGELGMGLVEGGQRVSPL